MKHIAIVLLAVGALTGVPQARAVPIFSDPLTSWGLSLNSGVAYITSTQLPANCSPARAEIKMSGSEYDKALFAYALDARGLNRTIRVVVDNTESRCVVMGISTA